MRRSPARNRARTVPGQKQVGSSSGGGSVLLQGLIVPRFALGKLAVEIGNPLIGIG